MYLGLDLGTTTIVGVLFDAVHSRVRRATRRTNDAARPPSRPTRAEQDPRRIRSLTLEVLRELAAEPGRVDGIGVTGQMHGLLCVDVHGEPLTPFISWQDRRTAEPLPDGSTVLDRLEARLAGLAWHDNGCRVAHGYGGATLFWLAYQGALPPGTSRACTLPGWLAGQLTGRLPVTDPTLAASWGLYHLTAGNWNHAFVDRLGLPPAILPPVLPSGAQMGGLAPGVAREVGLLAGVPVSNALADHAASFLGSVPEPARAVLFNLGTGGQIAWWVPAFELPDERVETHPFPGSGWLRFGASLCGGAAYAWLNRTVRAWLAEFGLEPDEATVYARLNALAAAADPAGLAVRTTFLGVRGEPSVTAGAIEGITLDNLRLGALARATLLGAIDELHALYQTRAPAGRHSHLIASGNGVQKNPVLPGLLEERFALPVEMPRWAEPAAVGAAMSLRL